MGRKRHIDPFLDALKRLMAAGLLLALVVAVGYRYARWIRTSDAFRIRRLDVAGNDFLSDEAVLDLADVEIGDGLWGVSLGDVEEGIGVHPLVSGVKVVLDPPDGLRIRVEEKRPLALLNVEGELYCIDEEGLVLPSKPGKLYDLPVLSGDFKGGVRVGSNARSGLIQEGLAFLKTVLRDRPSMYTRISEVVLGRGEGLILFTHREGLPVWMGSDDYGRKIRYLEALLEELRGKKTDDIDYVDVRFRGQIFVGMRT